MTNAPLFTLDAQALRDEARVLRRRFIVETVIDAAKVVGVMVALTALVVAAEAAVTIIH